MDRNHPKVKKALEEVRQEAPLEGMADAFNIVLQLLDGEGPSGVAGPVDRQFQRIKGRIIELRAAKR